MNKKKKITAIVAIVLFAITVASFIMLIFGIMGLNGETEREEENAKTLILISIILILIGIIPLTIYAMTLLGMSLKKTLDLQINKDHLFSAYLHIYASKNSRYCYNYLFGSKHDANPHIRMNDILFGDAKKYNYVEVYDSTFIDEKIDEAFDYTNVLDARKIDNTLYFEVQLLTCAAYVYVSMNLGKYELIILNQSEIKKREEINNTKFNMITINSVVKECYNEFFKRIKDDNRDIIKSFDNTKKLEDVLLEISEQLKEFDY